MRGDPNVYPVALLELLECNMDYSDYRLPQKTCSA